MKTKLILIGAVLLAGCADMTPREKFWTETAVAVVVVGSIAAYKADHDGNHGQQQGGAAAGCVYHPTSSLCAVGKTGP